MKDVSGYLKQQQSSSSTPETAAKWHALEDLYNKRLWHQLTLNLTDFVKDPCFKTGDGLIQLYENFICDFEHRINPLSLVEIILYVARQMPDPKDAITFLEKTKEKVKSSEEAVILCKTSIGSLKLEISDLPATKKIIEEVEEILNNLPGVTSVHGRFYDLSSKYYRIIGNHASYYKDALRYLGCVDVKDLPGGAAGDEGGPEGADDLGAAPSPGPAAGQITDGPSHGAQHDHFSIMCNSLFVLNHFS
uniref:Proteasome 26S subunit, non-ATPase 13 n=1 Tax=Oryzias melastigma TaxID=30732 RepID=A0A3B3BXC2_ORYME